MECCKMIRAGIPPSWKGSKMRPIDWSETFEQHWKSAQSGSLIRFWEQYSLHDSSWIGAWFDPLHERAVLAFHWDTFWTENRVPYPGNEVEHWPTLLIRLNKFILSYYDKYDSVDFASNAICGASTRPVTREEREPLLTGLSSGLQLAVSGTDYLFQESLVLTTILGDMGKWHFLHDDHVDFLCLLEDGQAVVIPSV